MFTVNLHTHCYKQTSWLNDQSYLLQLQKQIHLVVHQIVLYCSCEYSDWHILQQEHPEACAKIKLAMMISLPIMRIIAHAIKA